MAADSFVFKEFEVIQSNCAMKVGTDAVLLGAWFNVSQAGNVLDIGTGTGILAIMAAQRSHSFIDAIEIDEEAYRQALDNCKKSKWSDRIAVYHTSLQEYVPAASKKYDVIVSNPPYFSNSLQAASEPRTMARHTCSLNFEELIDGTALLLKLDGTFGTILPIKEAESFTAIAKRYGLYASHITYVKTTCTKPAKRVLLQFGFQKISPEEGTLIIEDEAKNDDCEMKQRVYSDEYKKLTCSFYLGF